MSIIRTEQNSSTRMFLIRMAMKGLIQEKPISANLAVMSPTARELEITVPEVFNVLTSSAE